MTTNNADLIFEKWKASLRSKNRKKDGVADNFDELFEDLKRDGTDFKTAHAILDKAIKAHQPALAIVKNTYKLLKKSPTYAKSEKEFHEDWNQSIADQGTESFYSFFDIKNEDVDDEPKVYGGMSAREYRLQRKYADSFPRVDTQKIREQLKLIEQYNSEEDLLNVLGLGENNGKANE